MLDTVAKVNLFKQTFLPVNTLTDECLVHFYEDGIAIPAVDRARMATVDVTIQASAFSSYNSSGLDIGIKLKKLSDALNMAKNSDMARMHFNEEDRLLELNAGNKEFVLGLINQDEILNQPEMPNIDHPVRFTISQDELEETIKTAELFSDELTFVCSSDSQQIDVLAQGDVDRTVVELTNEELEDLIVGNIENEFSLKYLKKIVSGIPSDTAVDIQLSHDRPIEIHYSIADGLGRVSYALAPYQSS
ncbi:hypothetical protein [Natronorubrum sp. FCH18a]|uniref:hypothetical protein n=1 Tax=Natronorubrum sp. FCH18a TaxID=3447018 RepID=UPI003F51239A